MTKVTFNLFILFAVLISGAVSDLFAQDCSQAWRLKYPSPRYESSIAYDSQRARLVVFGGESYTIPDGKTWEWDGSTWHLMSTDGPSPRYEHRLVYDSVRHVTVLFGGNAGGLRLGDTWEWDGVQWTEKHPVSSPTPRFSQAMAYDSSRQRVVLFGGNPDVDENSETWEWDGNNWEQKFPANHPSGRRTSAMTYDSARQVVVLWGGYLGSTPPYTSDETWEWDGTNWTLREPEHRPGDRDRVSMAYDPVRQVSVLFTFSQDYYNRYPETWEWNGNDWTKRNPLQTPPPSDFPALTYDGIQQKVVMFSGYAYAGTSGESGDIWVYDGVADNWSTVFQQPSPRNYVGMAYDSARSRTVLYGGQIPGSYYYPPTNETWEDDGLHWIKRQPAHNPPELSLHSMAYDTARQKTVLFGGSTLSEIIDQTWEWDGTDWTQRATQTVPEARYGASMAYDQGRGVVVMFGGTDLNGYNRDDTWEWDGADWTLKNPQHTPGARANSGMAYDPVRQVTVLYGGSENLWPLNTSAWEWDGVDWVERQVDPGPGPLEVVNLVFAGNLQRILIYGPTDSITWTFNGGLWQDLGVGGLQRHNYAGMVFDEARSQALLFGGNINASGYWRPTGDTYVLNAGDQDLDGTLDCADGCPEDPLKVAAGICGCGVADADDDGDLVYNCHEECDSDPLKTDPGQCGCNVPDIDDDGDGSMNCLDNCPSDPQKTAPGVCGCGTADVDSGGNGVLDCLDAGIQSITPAAPKLKLTKKKTVSVTMTAAQGVKYAISYKWLTGNKKKDKKAKTKNLLSLSPSATVRGAKIGLQLVLSYHYLVDGPATFRSLESRQVKLKVKKFPKK